MKKSLLIISLFLCISYGTSSQRDDVFKSLAEQLSRASKKMKKKIVAVYGFDIIGRADDSYTKYATAKLTHELVNEGTFTVIERSRIDQVIKEQRLTLTGAIDTAGAAQIGKILSVEGVVIGTISINENEIEYIVRIVQSETAVILASAQAEYQAAHKTATKTGRSDAVTNNSKTATNTDNTVVLTTSKKVYKAGESIPVTYSGLPGNNYDWITLVPQPDPDDTFREWFYTNGNKKGSYTFKAVQPGSYEIRVYFNWPKGGYIVKKRIAIKVK